MRWLGAALLAAGCAWLGVGRARQLRARAALLRGVAGALEAMRRELSLRYTAVPELLEGLSRSLPPPANGVFRRFRGALEGGARLEEAWGQALEGAPCSPGDRRLLLPLGRVLGRYDAPGQAESLACLEREVRAQLERAEEEGQRLGKVYAALGAAGGMFLAILLL